MKQTSLIFAEIWHRKLSFLIALIAIAIAVASCVGVITLADAFQRQISARVQALDDEIRKITKNMGFNIMILPRDQNLADFHASDFAEKMMPQEYVQRLADSPNVVTIQHLRPALVRKLLWPEKKRQIVLMGVSGIVPFAHRNPKKPLAQPVSVGTMNMGKVIADELSLKKGDSVELLGESFTVGSIYPARGSKDDVTVWMDLATIQRLLELPEQINMIQALECNCATVDRLAEIQQEIGKLLGDEVQVIEMATTAIARAKSRNEVKVAGIATVNRIQEFGLILLPLVIAAAALLVGLLSLANVRQRRAEIGVLRAIGFRTGQVMMLFLSKALLLGLIGAAVGFGIGFIVAQGAVPTSENEVVPGMFRPRLLMLALLATPCLTLLASWLPAVFAVSQDPATVLREE